MELIAVTIETGDCARLIKIPDDILDGDLRKIFEQCLGHVFPVGHVSDTLIDLEIGERFGRKSYMESIYVEHDCIEIVCRRPNKSPYARPG